SPPPQPANNRAMSASVDFVGRVVLNAWTPDGDQVGPRGTEAEWPRPIIGGPLRPAGGEGHNLTRRRGEEKRVRNATATGPSVRERLDQP
ncbi:MAG: hypothetical protein OEO23_04225, partial [Gemmatimonadota bacterium]|nr:hypothetical protein [Gemmatimonadota bacterium]